MGSLLDKLKQIELAPETEVTNESREQTDEYDFNTTARDVYLLIFCIKKAFSNTFFDVYPFVF